MREASKRSSVPHPESICVRCRGTNPVWTAPSPLWNEVMRSGDINDREQYAGIVCPSCFASLASEAGIADGWRLTATDVHVELQEVTPSGRVWNDETWLWDDRAEHSPSAERTEIERLRLALTRAMDRGNQLEAERDSLAARLRAQGYNVTEILMHDLGSAPVPEAPTPLSEYAELEGTLMDGLDDAVCRCGGKEKGHINFDRSFCACGAMHYYCDDCGWQCEPCDEPRLDSEQK